MIHILDSKSSKKADGQPWSVVDLVVEEVDVESDLRGLSQTVGSSSVVKGADAISGVQSGPVALLLSSSGVTYSFPRHHMRDPGPSSFLGSGSQKYCTIRL